MSLRANLEPGPCASGGFRTAARPLAPARVLSQIRTQLRAGRIQPLAGRTFQELLVEALLAAEHIAMPWVHLMLDSKDEMLELVFDRFRQTSCQRPDFDSIRWMSILLEHG